MSKFENEQEKKVREIIFDILDYFYIYDESGTYADSYESPDFLDDNEINEQIIDKIMLRIRPFLRVEKKWMGDCL